MRDDLLRDRFCVLRQHLLRGAMFHSWVGAGGRWMGKGGEMPGRTMAV